MAFGLSSLIVSATAMIPKNFWFFANKRGVFPLSASKAALCLSAFDMVTLPEINDTLPPSRWEPSTVPSSPFPTRAVKLSACNEAVSSPLLFPSSTIAFASGCSLFASSANARLNNSLSEIPSAGTISVTFGVPFVMVPVLSSATIWTFPVSSSDTAVLNNMPFFAPSPFPTIIATGVASPSAHGQLITNTEMPLASAYAKSFPRNSQTRRVTSEMLITTGTNTPETLSATFAIGAFVAAASLTILIIWESVVSSPTRDASQRR